MQSLLTRDCCTSSDVRSPVMSAALVIGVNLGLEVKSCVNATTSPDCTNMFSVLFTTHARKYSFRTLLSSDEFTCSPGLGRTKKC
jgi:hypothetical protein